MRSSQLQPLLVGFVCALPTAFSFQGLQKSGNNAISLSSPRQFSAKGSDRREIILNSDNDSSNQSNTPKSQLQRDEFFSQLLTAPALVSTALLKAAFPQQALAADEPEGPPKETQENGITMYKTNSGLKYIELQEGTGPTPRYGQLLAIQYTGYLKLPTESKPQKFDANDFLVKHGNGRIIAGLDEGLHTMKVGGKRRMIISPKLGYVQSGLGPIPELPWNRWALNGLLEKMVQQKGGNLVFEVELLSAIDDEADQGYYEDASPTPAEFERLRLNFQERNSAAATAREAENEIVL